MRGGIKGNTIAKKRPGHCVFVSVVGNLHTPLIYNNILKFCESINPINPGDGTFKLSMLNKEMKKLVLRYYKE